MTNRLIIRLAKTLLFGTWLAAGLLRAALPSCLWSGGSPIRRRSLPRTRLSTSCGWQEDLSGSTAWLAGELWNVNSPRRCRSAREPVVGQASSPAATSPTCFPWALRPARVKVFSVFNRLWCKSLLVGLLTVDRPGILTESHACHLIS